MSESDVMLSIRNVYKRFGENNVLNGVNIEVCKGEVVVILGPSGSGKTTLLRCINFLEQADEGSITVNRYQVSAREKKQAKIRTLRRKTAMVFQQYNLFRNRTAVQNVMEGLLVVKKMPRAEAEEKALKALDSVGLLDKRIFILLSCQGDSSRESELQGLLSWNLIFFFLMNRHLHWIRNWSEKCLQVFERLQRPELQ